MDRAPDSTDRPRQSERPSASATSASATTPPPPPLLSHTWRGVLPLGRRLVRARGRTRRRWRRAHSRWLGSVRRSCIVHVSHVCLVCGSIHRGIICLCDRTLRSRVLLPRSEPSAPRAEAEPRVEESSECSVPLELELLPLPPRNHPRFRRLRLRRRWYLRRRHAGGSRGHGAMHTNPVLVATRGDLH